MSFIREKRQFIVVWIQKALDSGTLDEIDVDVGESSESDVDLQDDLWSDHETASICGSSEGHETKPTPKESLPPHIRRQKGRMLYASQEASEPSRIQQVTRHTKLVVVNPLQTHPPCHNEQLQNPTKLPETEGCFKIPFTPKIGSGKPQKVVTCS
jgi:hypothetical protein